MRYDTTAYENSHGHRPRGRGMWLMTVEGDNGEQESISCYGTATDAKKRILEIAREKGINPVKIIPLP